MRRLLALLVVCLAPAVWAVETEPSACDGVVRPKGIGYVSPPNSKSCLFTAPNGGGTRACQPLDTSSNCFAEAGKSYDYQGCLRRYGQNFHGVDASKPRFLSTDFETIYQDGNRLLQQRCCEGRWGTTTTLSCFPTHHELHDWYASTQEVVNTGRRDSVAIVPGVPRITKLISPTPGRVEIEWITRPHDGFEVRVGSVKQGIAGNQFSTSIDLPPGEGGELIATVVAFRGPVGRSSLARKVEVVPVDEIIKPDIPDDEPASPTPPIEPAVRQTVFCVRYTLSPGGNLVMEKIACP